MTPKRLGFAIPISYQNVVLVSPTSKLLKPNSATFDLSSVVKADAFVSSVDKIMEKKSIIEAPKIIGSDALRDFGQKLVRLHRPGTFDYASRFGLKNVDIAQNDAPYPDVVTPLETASSSVPAAIVDKPLCRSCRSDKLSILYGKFGYYFKCAKCEGNTPIKISCGKDGHNERIRKEGKKFYRECSDCGSSKQYFVNT
jgi:hypothetical protein